MGDTASTYRPQTPFLLLISGPDLQRQAELADGVVCLLGTMRKSEGLKTSLLEEVLVDPQRLCQIPGS